MTSLSARRTCCLLAFLWLTGCANPATPPALSISVPPAATVAPTLAAAAPTPVASLPLPVSLTATVDSVPSTTPLPAAPSNTPTVRPTPVVLQYRLAEHTVEVSADGINWQSRSKPFVDTVMALLAPAANPQVVYILTTTPLPNPTPLRPILQYVIQASRDGAQTWQAGATDKIGGCYSVKVGLQALKGAPPDDALVVATQCADSPSDSRGLGMAARLSTDGGRSFVWSGSGDGIVFGQTREGILRFIPKGSDAERLALSTNKGATWQTLKPPALDIGFPSSFPVLEIDSADAAGVRLRERFGQMRIWQSRDGGHSWAISQ